GIYSANYVAQALAAGRQHDRIEEIDNNWRQSEIAKDLYPARNFKYLWQKFSIILAGLDIWWLQIFNQNLFKNLQNQITKAAADYQRLRPARAAPHATSKTDSSYNNSIAESLFYANLTHSDNQPNHLYIKNMALQYSSELKIFGGPSALYCPAGVYEWQENEGKNTYVINSQNCLHCKTCEIKDPNQNIQWQCPQGGSGPNYTEM
ncbi:MAG: 4Fe-4S dicluster domain-containing protein, partial [Alphaproteobacteria bacterium]|nr:4Fe-4S dicluster domain-containing protein [Alphaproteobacteria bacterium]